MKDEIEIKCNKEFWICVSFALFFLLVNCYFATRNFDKRIEKLETNNFNERLAKIESQFSKILTPKPEVSMWVKVKNLIIEQLCCDPDKVFPESRLIEDLGADSLDLIELIMVLEEELNIEIPDEDAEKLTTVKDVIIYCEAKAL